MPNYNQNQSYRLPQQGMGGGSGSFGGAAQPGVNRYMKPNANGMELMGGGASAGSAYRPAQNMDSATSYAPGGGGSSAPVYRQPAAPMIGAGSGNALTGGRPVQNQSFRLPQQQPIQNQSFKLPQQQPQQFAPGMMYANQGNMGGGGGLDQAQLYRMMLDRQRQQQGGGTWGGQGSPYFQPGDYGVMPGNMGW
jgi:hypothetical protein